MPTATVLRAAADSDAGLHRDVNEDRVHVDLARGLFLVIDGVGGQAAGGKAADIALTTMRSRLERETGPIAIACARRSRSRTTRSIAPQSLRAGMERDGVRPHRRRRRRWARGGGPRRRHAPLQAPATNASTRSRAITRRSASAKTPTSSPSSRRCTTRGATRCIATSAPTRTSPTIRISSTCTRSAFEPDAALLLCSDGLTDLVDSSALARDRQALRGPARPGREGADRRRQCRRRQGQRQRRLRRRGAVRTGRRTGSRVRWARSRGAATPSSDVGDAGDGRVSVGQRTNASRRRPARGDRAGGRRDLRGVPFASGRTA